MPALPSPRRLPHRFSDEDDDDEDDAKPAAAADDDDSFGMIDVDEEEAELAAAPGHPMAASFPGISFSPFPPCGKAG